MVDETSNIQGFKFAVTVIIAEMCIRDRYYYDSAVPRAFISGKIIFLSMGMLELMNDLELKAVLAHEVWHLCHNNEMPVLRQLSFMTFTKNCSKDKFEILADIFAGKIVNMSALDSARAKLT